jgi:AraC family transcriptional regulator
VSVAIETLWYLEGHLSGDLSLDAIADTLGVSRFHVSRAFAIATGHALSEYARARRLSEAAKALAAGAPDILALAIHAGYGSHEAFTRAFRQHFGSTPEQVRAHGPARQLNLTEPLRMNQSIQNPLAAPRMTTRDALLIFGLSRRYGSTTGLTNAAIPSQWDKFLPHFCHIDNQIGKVSYGVCYNTDDSTNWDYLSGVEVSEFPAEPAEFARLRIPAARYAVFEHKGHVTTIQASWQYVWEHGLRSAGVTAADAPCFEFYGENFDSSTGRGGFELWIPIR